MEHDILFFIQENIRQDTLSIFMKMITVLGNPIGFFSILGFLLLLSSKTRNYGKAVLLSLLMEVLIVNVGLKNIFQRMRPYDRFPDLIRIIEAQKDYSFPSGHSGISMAVSSALFFSLPKERKYIGYILLILALIVCLSRMYLGVHYPTDVLTGAVIGLACGKTASVIEKNGGLRHIVCKDNMKN